jgi:hypothetical protein
MTIEERAAWHAECLAQEDAEVAAIQAELDEAESAYEAAEDDDEREELGQVMDEIRRELRAAQDGPLRYAREVAEKRKQPRPPGAFSTRSNFLIAYPGDQIAPMPATRLRVRSALPGARRRRSTTCSTRTTRTTRSRAGSAAGASAGSDEPAPPPRSRARSWSAA